MYAISSMLKRPDLTCSTAMRVAHALEELVERRALLQQASMEGARRHVKQPCRDLQRGKAVLLLEQEPADASGQSFAFRQFVELALANQRGFSEGLRVGHLQGDVQDLERQGGPRPRLAVAHVAPEQIAGQPSVVRRVERERDKAHREGAHGDRNRARS